MSLSKQLILLLESIPDDIISEIDEDAVDYTPVRVAVNTAIKDVSDFELTYNELKATIENREEKRLDLSNNYAKARTKADEYNLAMIEKERGTTNPLNSKEVERKVKLNKFMDALNK